MWRRLVARYLGVVEAVGSSPATQTSREPRHAIRVLRFFFFIVFCFAFKVDYKKLKRKNKQNPCNIYCYRDLIMLIVNKILPFFSEVVKTQTCRRLMLSLFTHTCNNKNNDCYDVRQHFEKFLGFSSKSLNIVVCIAQCTENKGT